MLDCFIRVYSNHNGLAQGGPGTICGSLSAPDKNWWSLYVYMSYSLKSLGYKAHT